ncbi:hypothetical protein SAMN04489760_11264 [Syntrophus gentianae]|uniref:Uncharacterized protein n=1 Tax=Syntrophus gentianae TaxID=43775 RepID=A0A1H7XV76_9BACT|nr:DUF4405 domain-containing protein [Syntrophus gentianae]SEM37786.1 hypothetical protein SAMN04489760_11264 [Syntrophus gentianae]
MKRDIKLRKWATPLTIGAFALSAVTGILLFFKIHIGLVKPVHEWLSWLLVLGAIFHTIANHSFFMRYLAQPVGRGILIVFGLLICLSFFPLNNNGDRNPYAKMSNALSQSSLSAVAKIAHHEPEEAVNILRAKGIYPDSKDQTIQEIAAKNNSQPLRVLSLIF